MPNFFDMEVTRDQIIVREGDPADRIYIIKEGEFGVCKKLIHK